MINYHKGNLLDVKRGVIIHGCNAQGVMGAGVALAVKNKYPGAFEQYREECEENFGSPYFLGSSVVYFANDDLHIVNLITQNFCGSGKRQVNYGAIAEGFADLNEYYPKNWVFHFPKIGAGLGGGDWEVISEIIEHLCTQRSLNCWEL